MSKDKKYKWEFENIGGSLRVKIASGADIAHLSELDPKMWTVLSCPVKGLEINEKSLSYIDLDADGKIRINDVVKTAEWITGALKNPDLLLQGSDSIEISQFNTEDASGAKLAASSRQILGNLGKEGETISMSDTADIAARKARNCLPSGKGLQGSAKALRCPRAHIRREKRCAVPLLADPPCNGRSGRRCASFPRRR